VERRQQHEETAALLLPPSILQPPEIRVSVRALRGARHACRVFVGVAVAPVGLAVFVAAGVGVATPVFVLVRVGVAVLLRRWRPACRSRRRTSSVDVLVGVMVGIGVSVFVGTGTFGVSVGNGSAGELVAAGDWVGVSAAVGAARSRRGRRNRRSKVSRCSTVRLALLVDIDDGRSDDHDRRADDDGTFHTRSGIGRQLIDADALVVDGDVERAGVSFSDVAHAYLQSREIISVAIHSPLVDTSTLEGDQVGEQYRCLVAVGSGVSVSAGVCVPLRWPCPPASR
jgi:hypothetical protein